MNITLSKLVLSHFKGIKQFELVTNGKSVTVRGDNRTGKTTLADAFSWVLFGKDSKDKTDFGIKTTDENGNEIPGLEHSVECELLVDGKKTTFKRVYRETKTGNTTDYFVKDISVKKSEYEAYIAEIIDLNTFKLLTNPMYFNSLHWEKQREVLLEVCGDISDADVIASDSSLTDLSKLLEEYSFKELESLLTTKKKAVNEERKLLPARLEEVRLSIADVGDLDETMLQTQLDELKAQRRAKEQELVRIRSGSEIVEKQKQITQLEREALEVRNEYVTRWQADKENRQKKLDEARTEVRAIEDQINRKQLKIKTDKALAVGTEEDMARLRNEWHEVNKREFHFCQNENCPACDRPLPAEKLDAAKAKALADFNLKKSQDLQQINQVGVDLKHSLQQIQQTIAEHEAEIQKLTDKLNVANDGIKAIEAGIKQAEGYLSKADNLDHVELKRKRIAELQAEIAQLQDNIQPAVDTLQAELDVLQSDIEKVGDKLQKLGFSELGQKRIKELLKQEKELAAQYEEIEGQLHMIIEFKKSKVTMLEGRINSKFQLVKWKLFDELENGTVKETCQAMINGVPYGRGLNTEAQFNAGLDIINTLSEHYNFVAPIIIDNAEAVTEFISTKAQLIKLVKPEIRTKADAKKYSELVVEVDEQVQKQEAV